MVGATGHHVSGPSQSKRDRGEGKLLEEDRLELNPEGLIVLLGDDEGHAKIRPDLLAD